MRCLPPYPRPNQENHWPMRLSVPMPPWVWEAIENATIRLNALVLTEIDGRTNIGYGQDCYLSAYEYLQDLVLMACWDVDPHVAAAVSQTAPRNEALWPVEEDWPMRVIYMNRGAYREIREWIAARSTQDLVGFIQHALRAEGAFELPREDGDMEPILRLQGSKNKIAHWVVRHIPKHRLFVDVHGGSGSVLGAKNPSFLEVFNDKHEGIVNLWRVVREQSSELIEALVATPYSRVEWASAKEADCPEDPVEWARRVLVASWQGYGGDWQRKSAGFRSGSALLSSRTGPTRDWLVMQTRIHAWVDRMRGVALECMKDLDLLDRYDHEDTFFYCDPPYHATVHKSNYRDGYAEDDHVALAKKLRSIKGKAMISGYDSPLYQELFEGWDCVRKTTRANRGVERVECLWLCPKTSAEIGGRLL